MEKRILIAFALSFLVFTVYMRLFAPPPVTAPEGAVEIDQEREPPAAFAGKAETALSPPIGTGGAEEADAEARRERFEREVRVETPLYQAVFSNRGATLRSFILKQHEDGEGRPFEMVPVEASERLGIHPLEIKLEDPGRSDAINEALFEVSRQGLRLAAEQTGSLEFLWADGRGMEVRKKIAFSGSSYVLDVEVSVRQSGSELSKTLLYGPGVGEELVSSRYVQPDKGVIQSGEELRLFRAADIDDGQRGALEVTAVGVSSHYFAALLVPDPGQSYAASLSKQSLELEGSSPRRDFITAALETRDRTASFRLFIGPKDHELLAALGPGLEHAIEYGDWMRFMALPLRSGLLWIHGWVGNYGWSIVLLTFLINVALVPLKHHSYVSMRKMQELSPQIKRIQERYKKFKPTDPRRQEMNKEVYGLYKQHNVSPLSGCLPMLLMIPFFFAFYRLLMVSIELRHAPFILWIQDLSAEDPYFVLPILMGVSQIVMQRMTPQTSADPVQAKLMMLMPVVFVFILAWAPSGLVLYWFANNLVSLAQQLLTNRILKRGRAAQGTSAGKQVRRARKRSGVRS